MYGAASLTLTDRFAWLIDGLCKAIGVDAQKRRMEAALAWAVWNRVRVLGARLVALMARVRSGSVPSRIKGTPHPGPPPQGGREECPHPSPPPQERERGRRAARAEEWIPAEKLPREFGWVRRALPETARFAGVLAYFLDDPEIAALVEKTPEAGRILRPLCHLLGVQAPEFLRRGAVVAQPTVVIAAEAPTEPAPPLPEHEPPASAPAADASVTSGAAVTPPAEDPALAYARRPGGLYWDGTGLRWS
jgi:hypothetical protein